ncbi:MAG: OmpA family protein [Deltaproteobacteria bacterium]|nr:OmpA family protein [Deltaproteobacteria bacterium]
MPRLPSLRASRFLLLAIPVIALAVVATLGPPPTGALPQPLEIAAPAADPAAAPPAAPAVPPDVPPVPAEAAPPESGAQKLPLLPGASDLGKKIDSWFEEHAGRRIHVQVDRPMYRPGETVWIKSWDLRARDLGAAADRKDVRSTTYELVGPRGDVVQRQSVKEDGGFANFQFDLAEDAVGGEYTVRVRARDGVTGERTVVVAGFEQPRLKLKLEMKRKAYGAGDTVEADFSVIRATGQALGGHPVRAVATVDGVELPAVKVTTNPRGDAVVRLALPKKMSVGDGLMTVLVEDGGVTESISRRIPIVLKALDLRLFPEGGELVEEVESRVYFEAQDPFGKPADVAGQVEDERGNIIVQFRSHKNGLGRFTLKPLRDRRYTAVVTAPAEARSRHPLPTVRGGGCVLRSYDDLDGQLPVLRVGVRCSQPRNVTVAAVQREQLFDAARVAVASGKETVVYLRGRGAAAQLGRTQGIARVTVFGEQLEPLAERLVYRNRRERLRIAVKPDRPSYGPREQVQLTVRTTGPGGKPVPAEVALAVVDDTVIAYADDKQGNILARLFLEPELGGRVEEPNVFLDLGKPESALALDLLLGTRGYRRFEWQPVMTHDYRARAAEVRRQKEEQRRQALERRREEERERREAYRDQLEELAARRRPHRPRPAALKMDGMGFGRGAAGGAMARPGVAARVPKEPRAAAAERMPDRALKAVPAKGKLAAPAAAAPAVAARPAAKPMPVVAGKRVARMAEDVLIPRHRRIVVHQAHIQILDKVYFAPRSANLKAISHPILDAVAATLAGNPQILVVEVQGHEDGVESQDTPNLGARRAQAVIRYLVKKGVAKDRLVARSYGPRQPIASNATVDGRERNRRVEWRIQQRTSERFTVARVFPVPDYRGVAPGPRTDFRDTVFWAPRVVTGADGKGQVKFTLSDAVTSFRVVAEGVALKGHRLGLVGRGEHVLRSDRPLSLNARLPLEVSADDEILVPVTLANERAEAVDARVALEIDKLLQPAAAFPDERRRVRARARDTLYYPLRVVGQRGNASIRVRASALGYEDEVARALPVTPVGFPLVASKSGNVGGPNGNAREVVDVGRVMPGSVLAQVQLYPSPLATMIGGLEGMLREPYGCFEQASSTNYPNVMLMAYMKQHRVKDEKIMGKAQRLLDSGYRRLVGFESKSRGYEWFGSDPAHEALTAYGLVQFLDMKRVFAVDDPMVVRTATWLKSRRDGQGGFQRHPRALDTFGRASPEVTNAYIIYGLSEAGQLDAGMVPEIETQRRLAQGARDPYLLALASNTLLNLPKNKAEGVAAAGRLAAMQSNAAGTAGAFPGADHSITRSSGTNLLVETTALSLVAMVKSGRMAEARAAAEWLQQHRGGFGQWGATQATVLALKALTRYAEASARTQAPGAVEVRINGQRRGRVAYQADHKEPIVFAALGEYFVPGANKIEIVGEGKEALPFSMAVEYRTRQPASAGAAPVGLQTTLARSEAKLGQNVRLDVTVTNRGAKGLPMTLARIGLPGGLTFQTWQLKELRDRGQIAFYETRPREVIIYFRQLEPGAVKRIPLELQATVPGRYTGPASSAYLYYGDDLKSWAAPLEIRVTP